MTTETPQAPVRRDGTPLEPRERTASDVLLEAARYIEEHGWTGDPVRGPNVACAWVAISTVAGDDGDWITPSRIFALSIGGESVGDIFDWNDAPDRTRDEVLAALRAAAEPVR